MKKKSPLLFAFVVASMISFTFMGCGKKDSAIQADIDKQTSSINVAGFTAIVKDGVVTLTGTSTDEAAKSAAQTTIAGIKGVKSVVNNITVAPPPPPPTTAPVVIAADDPLSKSVVDATKDFPTVKAEVKDGVITLTGDIQRADLKKLIQALNTLKPKKINNQLTIK